MILLIIDPSVPSVTGRIALGGEALPASDGTSTLARAGKGLVIGHRAYVAIGSATTDWKKAGHGRVVVVDTETDTVVDRIDLPDFKFCRALTTDPEKSVIVVGCSGLYADGTARFENSGFVAIDVSVSPAAVKATWHVVAFGGRGVALMDGNAAMIDGTSGVAVAPGEGKSTPTDALWLFDGAGSTRLAESTVSYDFGQVLYDPVAKHVLVGDASAEAPRLRRFDLSQHPAVEKTPIDVNPSQGLPPRYLGWY